MQCKQCLHNGWIMINGQYFCGKCERDQAQKYWEKISYYSAKGRHKISKTHVCKDADGNDRTEWCQTLPKREKL